jgi:hypothetical protein
MKRKFKQWWSTMRQYQQDKQSHLISNGHIHKRPRTYADGNPGVFYCWTLFYDYHAMTNILHTSTSKWECEIYHTNEHTTSTLIIVFKFSKFLNCKSCNHSCDNDVLRDSCVSMMVC